MTPQSVLVTRMAVRTTTDLKKYLVGPLQMVSAMETLKDVAISNLRQANGRMDFLLDFLGSLL